MRNSGRYSVFIRPILFVVDLLLLILSAYYHLFQNLNNILIFVAIWIFLSVIISFYSIYRFTKITKVISLITRQVLIFSLVVFAFLYVFKITIANISIYYFVLLLYMSIAGWRISVHFLLKKYRIITGSNYKQVIIIGANQSTKKLQEFFENQLGYGYRFKGFFSDSHDNHKAGSVSESFEYILNNNIDEVYCSVKELTNTQIKEFIEFCDVKVKTLKFIPDNKDLFRRNLSLNYYDIIPILSLREIPLDDPVKSYTKRIFDIVFSLFIIIFVLSWLIPVLGLIIVIESRGPIFFKQNRPGIMEKGFGCYKFRSMTINSRTEDSATRNDARITKVGKFIRKTSIDELPQFFNVLFGSMSVVGPRPHLWKQNEMYGTKISKYMVRHFVKPGVTGLAQIRGYRGEIESREDIVNRTKYDIFYIENWSLLLDLYIIVQTVINVFKGQEKAY